MMKLREGVDAGTAQVAGAIQGTNMAVGIRLPYLGKTLLSRVLSGAGGNLVQGTAGAYATAEVLKGQGYERQAERFNPWDVRARVLDVMLGAAFGGLAHLDAKLTPTDEAALLVANQARHLEDVTAPGRPATDADMTLHVDAMRTAIEQVLRGEDVKVDGIVKDMHLVEDDALRLALMEVADEAGRIAAQEAPAGEPIVLPLDPQARAEPAAEGVSGAAGKARRIAQEDPDLRVATGKTDADGALVTLRAQDALALADAEVAYTKNTAAGLFRTAAHCLLGAL